MGIRSDFDTEIRGFRAACDDQGMEDVLVQSLRQIRQARTSREVESATGTLRLAMGRMVHGMIDKATLD